MLTDLLVAGLVVAATPNLMHPAPTKANPLAERSVAAASCQGDARAQHQISLLEAHAAYAAMAPFSFARGGPGSAAPAGNTGRERNAAERESDRCKS